MQTLFYSWLLQTNSLSCLSTEGTVVKKCEVVVTKDGTLPEGAEWLGRHFENQLGEQSKHASTVSRHALPSLGLPVLVLNGGLQVTCSSFSNDVITWCLFQSLNFGYNVLMSILFFSYEYIWYSHLAIIIIVIIIVITIIVFCSIQWCFSICSPCLP